MHKRDSSLDTFMYYVICVITLGSAFFLRCIISQALRQATAHSDTAE